MRTDDVECAAWEPDGGYGDGAVVAGDMLAAARARGVRYRPNSPVRSLLVDAGRVTGVAGPDGTPEHAGIVVLAAGVWSLPLLATAGVSLPIETEVHKVAVLAHAPRQGAPAACIDSVTQTYFRPEAAGSMTLVGSFAGPRGADPDGVPDAATAEDLAPQVESASYRLPALADAGIARGVTGVYDMTPDARPLLGPIRDLDGLVVAAGFSGMGFKIAPAVGEGIAGLIAGPPPGSVDLKPFHPDRFADGAPIVPPHPYSDD
jgi:sarcosine oxidase, subunit beta